MIDTIKYDRFMMIAALNFEKIYYTVKVNSIGVYRIASIGLSALKCLRLSTREWVS